MSGFVRQGVEAIYAGQVIDVYRASVRTPDGHVVERDVVGHPGAVAVVAIDANDRVILERQYRAAPDCNLLEIPAGKRDIEGEPPAQTARRELIEETGFDATSWTELGSFYNSPGFTDEFSTVFLATDLIEVGSDLQGPEELAMEIVAMPLADVWRAITAGEIVDGKSLIGLLWALRHLER